MVGNRIIIADDHPLFLEGLQGALLKKTSSVYVQTANSYLNLFSILEECGNEIDLLIMDLHMPGATNETGIYYIRKRFPELPIIVLSAHDGIDVRMKCLESGASDFLSKSSDVQELVSSIKQIINGEYQYPETFLEAPQKLVTEIDKISLLTPSQFKVLHLIADGHSNKKIADILNISEKTVKNHISIVFEKLEVSNRTQASNLFNRS
jgi:DNA-binding NarL/FixJ family response regulator